MEVFLSVLIEQGMGMKRPAEEDYNSNVHAKRSRDEGDDGSKQLTLRFLLQSKVRLLMFCPYIFPDIFLMAVVFLLL